MLEAIPVPARAPPSGHWGLYLLVMAVALPLATRTQSALVQRYCQQEECALTFALKSSLVNLHPIFETLVAPLHQIG